MSPSATKNGIDPGLNINLDWQSLSLNSELSDPLQSFPTPPSSSFFPSPPEQASLQWVKQLGTTEDDFVSDIATDSSGNLYMVGSTMGDLFVPRVNRSDRDGWLAKFDSNGTLLWGQHIATPFDDLASSVTVDSDGNIYVAGNTGGILGSGVTQNDPESPDAWLAKYDSNGNRLWAQQKQSESSWSHVGDLEVDRFGSVYMTGLEGFSPVSSWVARYDTESGVQTWEQDYSISFADETKNIYSQGLTIDRDGNLYVALEVEPWRDSGGIGRSDPHPDWDNGVSHPGIEEDGTGSLISKYDLSGNLVWQKYLTSVSLGGLMGGFDRIASENFGNFYVRGNTSLVKYNSNGDLLWERENLDPGPIRTMNMTVDEAGSIYLSGTTTTSTPWAVKYDRDGILAWESELDGAEHGNATGIAIDASGRVYLAGSTLTSLGQANAGGNDIWLAQYLQVPDNQAPDSLRFSLDRNQYKATDTLTLKNGWVRDLDGAGDLTRIDLQLINASGMTTDLGSITNFTPASWSPDWAAFNHNLDLSNLLEGTYRLSAIAYDAVGAASAAFERQFLIYSNSAPEQLVFSLESNQFEANETLTLKNAWVFDKDGGNDLASIDFELIDAMGNAIDLEDVTQFNPATWSHQWANFDYSLNLGQLGLNPGIYTLRGTAYDLAGAQSDRFERQFQLNLPTTAALAWVKDIDNRGVDIAIDNAGNLYVTGTAFNTITQGQNNITQHDIWIAKYDSDGNLLWQEDWGSTSSDIPQGVTVDGLGNIYLTGYTSGSLSGMSAGETDAWLVKYDNNGNLSWVEQLGTTSNDFAVDVTVDETGNLYITGNTEGNLGGTKVGARDPWIAKYDNNGNLLWVEQWGRSGLNIPTGTVLDNVGNVYISGHANGEVWLAKYNANGDRLWTRELGTANVEDSAGIAADRFGNIYLTGFTYGSLGGANQGQSDVWLAKYNGNGDLIWTQQFGSDSYESSDGVAVDDLGNIYLTGNTQGSLFGTNAGLTDVWVAKYDSSGNLSWQDQWGTDDYEFLGGVAVNGDRDVYLLGQTGNATANHWIAKYS